MKGSEPQTKVSIDTVLFATDFSPASESVFSHAAAIVDRYHSKLVVAHVINIESFNLIESASARLLIKQAHEEAERKIIQLLAPLRLQPDRYQVVVAEGVISEVLMDIIRRNHIDVVVLGTHGRRALRKVLLGSVAEEIFRIAPCPVLTVGPKTAPVPAGGGLRHILYPLEFFPDHSKAAPYVVSLAEGYGAALTVINVSEDMPPSANTPEEFPPEFQHWIRDHISSHADLHKRVRFERGFGPATDAILDFASKEGVDMIVMSVRELDPVIAAHLPQSDAAHALVSHAPCPVLTIR
jgi:nucleotide-binding universal stress UspA family protein